MACFRGRVACFHGTPRKHAHAKPRGHSARPLRIPNPKRQRGPASQPVENGVAEWPAELAVLAGL
jgi:hypothetical protein